MDTLTEIKKRYESLMPHLNESTKRLWAASEAKAIGRGGVQTVSTATGLSRNTIRQGLKELSEPPTSDKNPSGRIRKPGGGRKKSKEKLRGLTEALDRLMEPVTRGDPESPLLWSSKSLRKLASELKQQGYDVSHRLVGELLKENGYSLQANRKTSEGQQHPDRDQQFEFIYSRVNHFLENNQPVISVDTQKKELVGNFLNRGREWLEQKNPEQVNTYDFPQMAEGRAIPYGVYDIKENSGWVRVGVSADTAEFAVASIRSWWNSMGQELYGQARQLLITADGGGSNGSRVRLWQQELQQLANETGLKIGVSHFPPGTSKWNKIEHRLFAMITKNWRGKPLKSYQTIVNLIASTRTETGLTVQCQLDTKEYLKGKKVSDQEMKNINIERNPFHGEWNYEILPQNDQVIS